MKIPNIPALYIGGGVLALLAVVWLMQKGTANKVGVAAGSAVVGAAIGVVSGAANTVVDSANSDSNVLKPLGSWIGGTIYDITH